MTHNNLFNDPILFPKKHFDIQSTSVHFDHEWAFSPLNFLPVITLNRPNERRGSAGSMYGHLVFFNFLSVKNTQRITHSVQT